MAAKDLIPWKPGQSGNPSGRPKRQRVTDHLMAQLDSVLPESLVKQIPEDMRYLFGPKPTFGQFAAFKLLATAIGNGDVSAFKEILERVEGKVAHKMDINAEVATRVSIDI